MQLVSLSLYQVPGGCQQRWRGGTADSKARRPIGCCSDGQRPAAVAAGQQQVIVQ